MFGMWKTKKSGWSPCKELTEIGAGTGSRNSNDYAVRKQYLTVEQRRPTLPRCSLLMSLGQATSGHDLAPVHSQVPEIHGDGGIRSRPGR